MQCPISYAKMLNHLPSFETRLYTSFREWNLLDVSVQGLDLSYLLKLFMTGSHFRE